MEDMDNKLLGLKLDELNTLPAGYDPNLDSKWTVLEASMAGERRTKRSLVLWSRVAAVFLLCAFLTIIFRPKTVSHTSELKKTTTIREVEIPRKQLDVTPESKKSVGERQSVLEVSHPVVASNELSESVVLQTGETVEHDTLPVLEVEKVAIASEGVSQKKKKIRYVQVDFNDEAAGTRPGGDIFYAKRVPFKLFGDHEPPDKSGQTNSNTALMRINF